MTLSPDRALLLLPHVPSTVSVRGTSAAWQEALGRWGISPRDTDVDLEVITADLPDVVHARENVFLTVAPRRRWLQRQGYAGVRYRLSETSARPCRLPATPLGALAARRRADITVAARGSVIPAAVTAASPGARLERMIVGGDPRRRMVFVIRPGGQDALLAVVKAERMSASEPDRGAREQAQLQDLVERGLGSMVPTPLGYGATGGVSWSMESFAEGRPLAVVGRGDAQRALDELATRFDELATATPDLRSRPWAADVVPLAGEHVRWSSLVSQLEGVPRVRCHGDLASGANVLVRSGGLTLIDWETAFDGPPLLDLLPALALGTARAAVGAAATEQASFVIALASGELPSSGWFFDAIRRHLGGVGVPLELAGQLATVAWAYQASMRARHDDLVREAGLEPPAWTSAAEHVITRWLADERLGTAWPVLGRGNR